MPSITKYLSAALGITCALLAIAVWGTYNMLQSCNEKRAALQQQVATLEDRLSVQNKAIEKWEKAGKQAQDRARNALAASRKRSEALDTEVRRLKATRQDKSTTSCPAGEAVQKIRDGLK